MLLNNILKSAALCQFTRNCLGRRLGLINNVEGTKWFSLRSKTHYEILNLSNTCTSKEIRDAFISLSKKYHPDKNNGNSLTQEQFVEVNEAYNVLIKPESRRDYDMTLPQYSNFQTNYRPDRKDFYEVRHVYRDPWRDPYFARNRNVSKENINNYYGVKGIKKQTNDQLFIWLLAFVIISMFVQLSCLRFTGMRQIESIERKSEENRQYLISVKERAEMLGTREQQIQDFKLRTNLTSHE